MGPWLIYTMIFVAPVLSLVSGAAVVRHIRQTERTRALTVSLNAQGLLLIITITFVILVLAVWTR